MIRPLSLLCLLIFFISAFDVEAQRRGVSRKSKTPAKPEIKGDKAIVVDERLAVLRKSPSLYAESFQRMRRGREVFINQTKVAEGVTFYRVTVPPGRIGWVQADAVVGNSRKGDDLRLARLVQASEEFDRIERASIFLEMYPRSELRPLVLLLFGDLMEEVAIKLSRRATRSLDKNEMAASGAPLHSFYLNYSYLDRYRKLGVVFLFNARTKQYHYDGKTWKELVRRYQKSAEAIEARKRLDDLQKKLEKR